MVDITVLCAVLRGMLPPSCGVGWADPQVGYPRLAGEDLPSAIPARLREFSAGRRAARLALDMPDAAIPMGRDRAPIWPEGFIGSITHSQSACLAAVAAQGVACGIGIDIEEDTPLARDLWPTVLVPAEMDWLAAQSVDDQGRYAKLIFSAKEAAYKAQHVQSRVLFGFEALNVQIGEGTFTATFRKAVHPFEAGAELGGRYIATQGHILTAVYIPA